MVQFDYSQDLVIFTSNTHIFKWMDGSLHTNFVYLCNLNLTIFSYVTT